MKLAYRAALTLIAFLAGADAALAASPVGLWTVTLLLEPNLTPDVTQPICFKADHTWFLPKNFSFKGSWFQKGDQFRWYGAGGTAAASTTQFVTAQLLTGTFDEFK